MAIKSVIGFTPGTHYCVPTSSYAISTRSSIKVMTSRLKPHEDTLDKRLLSKDEYERAREGVLRKFVQS